MHVSLVFQCFQPIMLIVATVILMVQRLMDGFSCSAPHRSVFHAGLSVPSRLQRDRDTFSIACAVEPAEARQGDPSVGVDVAVGPLVHPLDQVLLVQQRVVGAQRAGGVVELLVVMAQLRLSARRQELVDVHHLAQRHHHDGACTSREETTLEPRVKLRILTRSN